MKISQYDDDITPSLSDSIVTVKGSGNKEVTFQELLELFEQYINPPDYIDLSDTPDTITYVGNRSYALTFNGADHTDVLSAGMRLRLTRSVASPTRCTDLESGSSQYWNDTTVSGMTFTDDFVAGAWVKLESYGSMSIESRYNGTSGWRFFTGADGRAYLQGTSGGASNFRRVVSYQSLPLGRWVHVAAQLDMSAYTATSTTCYMMFDGVDVPVTLESSGTNPTSLTQAGNLEIGSENGGTAFFDGKLAQVFISSAKITQDNVRTLISQGLTASLISTHSIVSAYSFDGTSNDLNTTNANNLSPQNSALYTTLDTPFGDYLGGLYDYAIIASKPSYASNTTFVVQVPEGCMIPTSGGIATIEYSSNKVPYGFPVNEAQWRLTSAIKTTSPVTSNANYGSYLNDGWKLTTPIGSWEIGWQAGSIYNVTTTSIYWAVSPASLSGLTAVQGSNITNLTSRIQSPSAAAVVSPTNVSDEYKLTTAQSFVMYTLGATTSAGIDGTIAIAEIYAKFTLL